MNSSTAASAAANADLPWLKLYKKKHDGQSGGLSLSPKKIFVDKLYPSTNSRAVRSHFSTYGRVSRVLLLRRKPKDYRRAFRQTPLGRAVVEFAEPDACSRALKAGDSQLDGRLVRVQPFYELPSRRGDGEASDAATSTTTARSPLATEARGDDSRHAGDCPMSVLHPLAFAEVLRHLALSDWLSVQYACSCCLRLVNASLERLRTIRLVDASSRRPRYGDSAPGEAQLPMAGRHGVISNEATAFLYSRVCGAVRHLSVSVPSLASRGVTGELLPALAAHTPDLLSLRWSGLPLSVCHCRPLVLPCLTELAIDSIIGEDALWYLLKAAGRHLRELDIRATDVKGDCFHFLTDNLRRLRLRELSSPRCLRLLPSRCQSLSCLAMETGYTGPMPRDLPAWLGWAPGEFFAQFNQLETVEFFGGYGRCVGCAVNDCGVNAARWLSTAQSLHHVTHLRLSSSNVDDAAVVAFIEQLRSSLLDLRLAKCSLSVDTFDKLGLLERVRLLDVSDTEFGARPHRMPDSLTTLVASGCRRINSVESLMSLLSPAALCTADLSRCTGLTRQHLLTCLSQLTRRITLHCCRDWQELQQSELSTSGSVHLTWRPFSGDASWPGWTDWLLSGSHDGLLLLGRDLEMQLDDESDGYDLYGVQFNDYYDHNGDFSDDDYDHSYPFADEYYDDDDDDDDDDNYPFRYRADDVEYEVE